MPKVQKISPRPLYPVPLQASLNIYLHGVHCEEQAEPSDAHEQREETPERVPGEQAVVWIDVTGLARRVPDDQVHEPGQAQAEEWNKVLGLSALQQIIL